MSRTKSGCTTRSERDDLRRMAVSYMGWPLHFIASLLWKMMSELLALLKRTKTQDAGEKASSSCCELQAPATASPEQPLVRLKNLPQVGMVRKSVSCEWSKTGLVVPSAYIVNNRAACALFASSTMSNVHLSIVGVLSARSSNG